jgi:PAS domain S-box-containing protein
LSFEQTATSIIARDARGLRLIRPDTERALMADGQLDDEERIALGPLRQSAQRLRERPSLGRRETVALAVLLFVGVFLLRRSKADIADAGEILFVLPIALLAVEFGFRGGLAGALVALGLVVPFDITSGDTIARGQGYLGRAIAFLVLGMLLGAFVDRRRTLEAEISRYYAGSLDLLATADLGGRLIRVNPSWERVLGHSPQTLCSRPLIEFVHPDDREVTAAETAILASGSRDTAEFQNRCRTIDGSYRWFEWSAYGSPTQGVIEVVARDVSAQHEAELQLADSARLLEAKVAEKTSELNDARAEILQRLAVAAEYRDDDTFQHTERVGKSAAEIGAALGLAKEQIEFLREAAPLHDVGKLAISDSILLKPGKLTVEEYEVMKTHAAAGARVLSGSSSPVLQMATIIAATHHERWDGTGYPAGLTGEAIPLVGRVVAIADVYDALTHDRPYKAAWPRERAIAEIRRSAGSQFDPKVAAAFLVNHEDATVPARLSQPAKLTRPTRAGHSEARA